MTEITLLSKEIAEEAKRITMQNISVSDYLKIRKIAASEIKDNLCGRYESKEFTPIRTNVVSDVSQETLDHRNQSISSNISIKDSPNVTPREDSSDVAPWESTDDEDESDMDDFFSLCNKV